MVWTRARRQLVKQTLSFTKVKLLYARITLTRFTTAYFFLALFTFFALGAQQIVTFSDNSTAIDVLSSLIGDDAMSSTSNISAAASLVLLKGDALTVCDSLPGQPGTNCTVVLVFGANSTANARRSVHGRHGSVDLEEEEEDEDEDDSSKSKSDSASTSNSTSTSTSSSNSTSAADSTGALVLPDNCVLALRWLDDTMHDAQREDVVTFLFEIWLLILALVTILNESIPHLFAALLGHTLGAGWAGYRLSSTVHLKTLYQTKIVPDACAGTDVVGGWWDLRIGHAIPIVVVNGVTLAALLYLSFKLFRVYATESFSRVGASARIHRVYKIVLVFSVFLQLSGFFSLATSAMWIDKMCHGTMHELARHSKLYLAAFVVTLVLQFPWLIMGWICVRKECKIRFGVFCALSVFLVAIPTAMFESPMYRYIVSIWPFFATVTITAYVLLIVTVALAIVCRLNFGKGLKHYLQVTDALEGVDFTPVLFPKYGDEKDAEKFMAEFNNTTKPSSAPATTMPTATFSEKSPALLSAPPTAFPKSRKGRGSSIYSDTSGLPIQLSSSPPLVSELASPIADAAAHLQRRGTAAGIVPYPELPRVGRGASVRAPPRALTLDLSRTPSAASSASASSTGSSEGGSGRRIKTSLPANPRAGLGTRPGAPF